MTKNFNAICKEKVVCVTSARYRELGPELIPVAQQSYGEESNPQQRLARTGGLWPQSGCGFLTASTEHVKSPVEM